MYSSYLSQALGFEVRNKIDVMSYEPDLIQANDQEAQDAPVHELGSYHQSGGTFGNQF